MSSTQSSYSVQSAKDPALPDHQVRIRVREVVEWELLVDTQTPQWSWLAEMTEDQDEWVAQLDDMAGDTEGVVEQAIRADSPVNAWREVEYA